MKPSYIFGLLAISTFLTGCDVHDERLTGNYRLSAIDTIDQMSVYYSLEGRGAIGRINETVFAVGWDQRYIVAKQHPHNDRTITNYYYLEMAKDSEFADPRASVTGPLSAEEFATKERELKLPAFTRTIKSLE